MLLLTPTLLAALTLAADRQARPQEHPIAAEVRATLKDPGKPFTLVVVVKLKDGSGPQFEAGFVKVAKESRKEKGNRAYDLSRSVKEPAQYLVYERWDNLAALEAHLKSPHFQEAAAGLTGLLAAPPETRVLVPVGE